ncbi:MAG: hypothetical protein U0Q18_25400 [Bryobacteraceae bacterium]
MPLLTEIAKPEEFTPATLARVFYRRFSNGGDFLGLPDSTQQQMVDIATGTLDDLVAAGILK